MKKLIEKFKLSLASTEDIQRRITKAYSDGLNDATHDFQKNIANSQKRVSELTNEIIEQEKKYRGLYQKQLSEFESRIKIKCNKCQEINDDERNYLRGMQNILAAQLKKIDYMFSRIHEYLENVKTSHQEIMLNAGKVNATDYMVKGIENDLKELVKYSAKYLTADIAEKEFPEKAKIRNSMVNNKIEDKEKK